MSNKINQSLVDIALENGIVAGALVQAPVPAKLIVIVGQQEFIRGCLNSWIKKFCEEFELSSVADVTEPMSTATLDRATVAVFYASGLILADSWLERQIKWLRANRPNLPMVAIIDPDRAQPIAELVNQLRLHGYIPTSSSMEVAAAVLRLVAAGGTYIPYTRNEDTPLVPVGQAKQAAKPVRIAGLTPRECGVLELLELGMSNKIIAYRLSLSQSTVKAHVHNIIAKLKVHNRTEAAVASHQLQNTSLV